MRLELDGKRYQPQRVFCIGCNYDAHIKELGSCADDRCVIFMKPPTCLVPPGRVVTLPAGRGEVHHEVELVIVVGAGGRNIPRDRALAHIAGVTLGLDLTLRTVQTRLKQHGHPWELSKAFDQSAPLGKPVAWTPALDLANIPLRCRVNGAVRQDGNTRDMLFPVEQLLAIVSSTWVLQPGDLLFTGTPPGVGPVVPGDVVTIDSPCLGSFTWRMA